ncbi:hypothetical protein AB0L82_35215 [Nocardia sp. NPDC052001]|uniref:hypothetical protein n=1 Tax=Nocardia sp. NPDC052001 TaxID=3154853 RepID=UPI0034133A2A
MVTHSRRAARRVLLAVAVIVLAVFGPTATALADPGDSGGGGGTYGFNDACEEIKNGLPGIQIPGLPTAGDFGGGLCKLGNALTHPGDAVEAVRDKAWDTTFGKAVDSLLKGMGDAMILGLTWWTKIPTSTSVSNTDLFTAIRRYTFQLQIFFLSASLIVCAIRLAMAHRSAAAEQATESFRVLARAVFASAMFSTVLTLGTQASDAFSDWLIDAASNHDAKGLAEAMMQTQALTALSPGLVFAIAIIGMVGALMQAVIAVVREALLVVVVGVLPLAAASSGTHTGRQFHDRLLAWSFAFVLYKPCAAMIYMIAFKTTGTTAQSITKSLEGGQTPTTDQAQQMLVGIVLLCSAALVLPALMRLISPIAAMGGGISGAAATAGLIGMAASKAVNSAGATGAKSTPAGSVSTSGGARGGGGGGGGGAGTGARPAPSPAPPPAPSRAASGGGGGGGGRGPAGAAPAAGGARTTAAAGSTKAAAAAGPVGAVAVGVAKAAGTVAKGVDTAITQTATLPPVARPNGAGRAAVPR